MAPLVPDLIGNELNFIVALLIGIGFGFILEQAGFSTSKKLVGLFYGYDFTVLRVFFTAGITAMFGVILLGHFGLLDLNIIYINPTYLWSAIVGGLIMGLGFVVGGFCPGTGVCAAAIGKIDAIIFVLGSVIGVFVFAEAYPAFEGLYKAAFMGNVRVFDSLGMPQGLFAFLLVFMAVAAFIVTTMIENKVNGKQNPDLQPNKKYLVLAGIVVIIGVTAFALPEKQASLMNEVNDASIVSKAEYKLITSDELAYRLMDDDNDILIFDLRNKESFKELALPKSSNVALEFIFGKDAHKKLSLKNTKKVYISDSENDEKRAAYISSKLGYDDIYILKGGLDEFKSTILNFKMPGGEISRNDADTYRFRTKASTVLPVLIQNAKKQSGTETTKTKRVVGGC
ncbi:MAG: YeeE/YedE thiosulfate transporter family protein [Ignavibacteria bacterium]|nr:YeeE/YedE thiosulfate transporter family protein [Ignavibacteria bacterium]